jgi:hypothetical protein
MPVTNLDSIGCDESSDAMFDEKERSIPIPDVRADPDPYILLKREVVSMSGKNRDRPASASISTPCTLEIIPAGVKPLVAAPGAPALAG